MLRVVIERCPDKKLINMFVGRFLFRREKHRDQYEDFWRWHQVYQDEDFHKDFRVYHVELQTLLEQIYQSHKHESVAMIPRFPRLDPAETESVSPSNSEPEPPNQHEEPKKTGKNVAEVKRTKWGSRIYSNDGKHYFNVGVWKSKGYPGCTTIRLSVAGKNYMYTLDEKRMRALRAEISRGMPT
jgi:hypothetical protein